MGPFLGSQAVTLAVTSPVRALGGAGLRCEGSYTDRQSVRLGVGALLLTTVLTAAVLTAAVETCLATSHLATSESAGQGTQYAVKYAVQARIGRLEPRLGGARHRWQLGIFHGRSTVWGWRHIVDDEKFIAAAAWR